MFLIIFFVEIVTPYHRLTLLVPSSTTSTGKCHISMSTPTNIKLFWYGPRPPVPASIFHSALQNLYVDACTKHPEAAGFLMLLRATLSSTEFPAYFDMPANLYSIHVIPLDTELLTDLISTMQHIQANDENVEYFIL